MKKRNFVKTQSAKKYNKKSYRNPYFSKQRSTSKIVLFIILILAFVLTGFFIWFLVFSSFAQFKSVEVNGLTTIPAVFIENIVNDQMQQKRFGILQQDSKYFFDKIALQDSLMQEYDFASLTITTTRKKIDIQVKEKISEIIWKSGDALVFLNLEGELVRTLHDFEIAQIYTRLSIPTTYTYTGEEALPLQPTMPIIEDVSQKVVEDNQGLILSTASPSEIAEFDEGLRALDINPVLYEIDGRDTKWLRVKSSAPYDILFDASQGVGQQLSTLSLILVEHADRLNDISYIDIRFGNHVYIK